MERKPQIYFMGSGPFAVPVLEALTASPLVSVCGIATQPDKAAGRKRVLTPSPLGKWADANNFECVRVPSVNTDEFLSSVKALSPDLIVVVSFGQILKTPLLEAAPFGCLNVHASILPKYRGAAPIVSAVLNGDEETGVTFMKMEKGLDTGPIYEIHRMAMPRGITADALEETLAKMAGERLPACINNVVYNNLAPTPQCETGSCYASKIKKSDGSVNWQEDASSIERKVRAYLHWPCMSFFVQTKTRLMCVKITKAACTSWQPGNGIPGQFLAFSNNSIIVKCGTGSLLIERVHPEGKKDMSAGDFLNGAHVSVGEIFLNGPRQATATVQ